MDYLVYFILLQEIRELMNPQRNKTKNPNSTSVPFDRTRQLAFDNSPLPNIISVVRDGKIIAVNRATTQLLQYSKTALLKMRVENLFVPDEQTTTVLAMQRAKSGQFVDNICALRKDGKTLPCQITSVEFTGDRNIRKVISILIDQRAGIRIQKAIDSEREKQVDADTVLAQSKSDIVLDRLVELEHKLDQEISTNEQLKSSSRVQKLAKAREIETAVSEAQEIQRTDLGMELHDNVNQLLAASSLYLDIAQRNKTNRALNLKRSSEYTQTAIEEIRKLTKGLIKDVLNNLTLYEATDDLIQDLMKVHPIQISWKMDGRIHKLVNAKFNLNVFRIIQEQLSNIIKHAQATKAGIEISLNKLNVILTISDNGSGFDVRKAVDGIGIMNIKTRAKSFNGVARFASKVGQGCILTVLFPIAETQNH